MAGGGIKGGQVYNDTDEMSYNIVKDAMHIRDLQATILHAFGLEHERLSLKVARIGFEGAPEWGSIIK